MPELPEVEVVRRDLDREIVGKKIKSVDVDGMRAVRRHHNRKQFINRLVDRRILSVGRRGKYILCKLDGGDVLVVHLGMSGQLLRAKTSRDAVAKHTHVVITFTQGGQLRFVDPRTFGEMFVTELEEVEKQVAELAHLGIDPLETAMSWEHFGHLIAQRHAKLKPLLMDQKFIAGIGNLYSDEILWGAGLRWDRASDSLTSEEVRRLYRSMMEALHTRSCASVSGDDRPSTARRVRSDAARRPGGIVRGAPGGGVGLPRAVMPPGLGSSRYDPRGSYVVAALSSPRPLPSDTEEPPGCS